MRKIFLDIEHERFFADNGYIKLPFGRSREIDAFKEKIYALQPSDNFKAFQKSSIHAQDYHCTFFDTNMQYRTSVFEIMSDFFGPVCTQLLNNYRLIQGNVFIKPPHQGYVAPHQNLTVVDEDNFTSLSFWCPAQDTDIENGTMVVVPGSHRRFMKYRSTNISWPLLPVFQNYDSPFLKTINVKKGEFLIIDDSLIHGTTNNTTNFGRFVFHALVAPAEAQLIYCHIEKEKNRVKLLNVPNMFWQYYMPGTIPQGLQLWQERNYDEKGMNEQEIKETLNEARFN